MRFRAATGADYQPVISALPGWWWRDVSPLLQELFFTNFGSTSIVVEDDGGLAAFLIGFPSTDEPGCAYVHFIGVRPDLRGTGMGRDLHARFADAMAVRGITTIRCVTNELNEESIAFHQSIGFAIASISDSHVHFVKQQRASARPVLVGDIVTLTPTVVEDAPALFIALDHDAVWAHVRDRPESPQALAATLHAAEANGRWPWTVRLDGQVVGTTSVLEVSQVDARLEIGFTLYTPSVWGTAVNPECKLLLMTWAFETAGMGRVQLKIDIRNTRSQAAIVRLGAQREGVLRRYQRRQDGSMRDTVVFSVTAEEWPNVKSGLLARLRRDG